MECRKFSVENVVIGKELLKSQPFKNKCVGKNKRGLFRFLFFIFYFIFTCNEGYDSGGLQISRSFITIYRMIYDYS